MIFSIEPRYRMCNSCKQQVPYHDASANCLRVSKCRLCGYPFSANDTALILAFREMCERRVDAVLMGQADTEADIQEVQFSKFYQPGFAFGWHDLYAVPFYAIDEVLHAENLLHAVSQWQPGEYVASYCRADQSDGSKYVLRSWQSLLVAGQRFTVGDDEGPRVVDYTPFE